VERDLESAATAKGLDEANRCNVTHGTWFEPRSHAIVRGTGAKSMSWPELERLVADAEASQDLQHSLRHCHSPQDLLLAARRHGYRITRIDLQNAWLEHQQFPETPVHDALPGTAAWS
jgi:hypothetical protein